MKRWRSGSSIDCRVEVRGASNESEWFGYGLAAVAPSPAGTYLAERLRAARSGGFG
jgi:hypothetical protein